MDIGPSSPTIGIADSTATDVSDEPSTRSAQVSIEKHSPLPQSDCGNPVPNPSVALEEVRLHVDDDLDLASAVVVGPSASSAAVVSVVASSGTVKVPAIAAAGLLGAGRERGQGRPAGQEPPAGPSQCGGRRRRRLEVRRAASTTTSDGGGGTNSPFEHGASSFGNPL